MPVLLNHTTTTTTTTTTATAAAAAAPATPLDIRRTLRERNKIKPSFSSGAKHSPDGYFTHDEALLRSWRPLGLSGTTLSNVATTPTDGLPSFIRRRSKGHINGDTEVLQDVEEEEGAAGPDSAHPWRRPSRYDSRSPCPALNTAANHGYLPRHGRGLSMWDIIVAIRACYNVSWVLAILFTVGSFVILRWGGVGRGWLWPRIDLEELGVHGVLEHNASLTHTDFDEDEAQSSVNGCGTRSRSVSSSSTVISTVAASSDALRLPFPLSLLPLAPLFYFFPFLSHFIKSPAQPQPQAHPHSPGGTAHNPNAAHRLPLAPLRPSRPLIRALLADSASGTHLTLSDLARARLRRTATTGPSPPHLAQFSDAEFALTIAVLGGDVYGRDPKVKLEVLREWLEEERIPAGWRPGGVMGFWRNHVNTARMQEMMGRLRRYRKEKGDVRTVVVE